MQDEIGTAAGKIWNALNNGGSTTTEELKRTTKLNDKLMNQAIGWLARENKICLSKKGKYLNLWLNQNF